MNTLRTLQRSELPTDVAGLQDLVLALQAALVKLQQQNDELTRIVFGKKSEKNRVVQTKTKQGNQSPSSSSGEDNYTSLISVKPHQRRKKHPGRNAIPENILRVRHVLDLPDDEKQCTACPDRATCRHEGLRKIEEVVRKVVERKPVEYILHEYVRIKYGCPQNKDEIKIVEPPVATPIPRGLAHITLLLFVLVSKYRFHLPLFRIQRQIYHESGIWFTRSTMVGWIHEVCELLKPVIMAMILEVKLQSCCIYSDDSRVVRITQAVGSHTSFMWVYLGCNGRVAIFDYRDSKAGVAPREFLTGIPAGTYLMIDDNAAYNDAIKKYQLIALICWMHIRREFIKSADAGSQKAYALRILRQIRHLYRVEAFAAQRNMNPDQVKYVRQRLSVKIMAKIHAALAEPGFVLVPQERITKAINYALRNWEKSQCYLNDGRLPIDNGFSERILRELATGRSNWHFVGSDEGGKRMAILYSLNSTCKINGIDFEKYLGDILMRLAIRPPHASVADLTPIEWLKTKNNGILPPLQNIYPSDS